MIRKFWPWLLLLALLVPLDAAAAPGDWYSGVGTNYGSTCPSGGTVSDPLIVMGPDSSGNRYEMYVRISVGVGGTQEWLAHRIHYANGTYSDCWDATPNVTGLAGSYSWLSEFGADVSLAGEGESPSYYPAKRFMFITTSSGHTYWTWDYGWDWYQAS